MRSPYPSPVSTAIAVDPPSPTPRSFAALGGEGKRNNYTGVKNGSGAPSVGLNTTLTF
jgi:hypothetical protein